eukprot:CAMPEP_0118690000 /NCGR_PEP_ID=MMETSP0800-20121206/9817_1 /TAXON_ID=210618 ORGANISM="Striatella unipunctata, Strain CCMP2910" /NCGR_SAMPLE_ID=MMETSP0800 /ASSEMBLY_ACC=CAM_ASM_000638 /LENGTH=427 /DNA_ID=CAMNT_0006587491 /DNA_START=71 /DNA_END=1354 /DNA_ORIENTATION=+
MIDEKLDNQNGLGSCVTKSRMLVTDPPEYKSHYGEEAISLTEVPFYDVELVGVPALAFIGRETFGNNPTFQHLMGHDGGDKDSRFVICGGKGGVGKTTTSSSLAVAMAAEGHKVALVSTDPAHSLGDAFDMDFSGGALVDCPLFGMPPTDGSLSILEVNPEAALKQFKGALDEALNSMTTSDDGAGGMSNELTSTLREMGDILDTLPAGTDEVVALGKVVQLVKNGGFDRIVLDTAPTGHTLRMLSTPAFVSQFIDSILKVGRKLGSSSAVNMLLQSATSGSSVDKDAVMEKAKSKLISFQLQMYDLEDLFADGQNTEFMIVTVPTELAVRESVRLMNDLTFIDDPDGSIRVRNVIANQVLKDDQSDVGTFLNRVKKVQESSVHELETSINTMAMNSKPRMTKVPYIDTEPRGVFGLKVLSSELIDK